MPLRRPNPVTGLAAGLLVLGTALGGAPLLTANPRPAAAHDDHDGPEVGAEAAGLTEAELAALAESETASIGGTAALVAVDENLPGATAATRPAVAGECPVMTDSIRRLYRGFLERDPTIGELERNIALYSSGEANLLDIATALVNSGTFRTRYGPLNDEGFVGRVYANTLGREPSEADARHWLVTLDNGYPRGAVMLAFTESAEFVRRTATARPLSGYLAWYPRGVHWYCGVGARNDLPIRDLVGDVVFADYLFSNRGGADAGASISTILDGRRVLTMVDTIVPAGYTDFRWDGAFAGAGHYGEAIDVRADDQTSWVVVFYPDRIGSQRLGWQLLR